MTLLANNPLKKRTTKEVAQPTNPELEQYLNSLEQENRQLKELHNLSDDSYFRAQLLLIGNSIVEELRTLVSLLLGTDQEKEKNKE